MFPLPIFLGLVLGGCSPEPATVTADAALPSVALVQWSSTTSGKAQVRLERDGAEILTTPLADASSTEHQVRVAGLLHGVEHTLVPLLTDDEGGLTEGESVHWRAPSAPADLPLFQVAVTSDALTPGYVALHTLDRERDAVVIVDREGRVVWYLFVEEGLAVLSVSLSRDGKALWFVTHATDYVETGATIHHVALDGSFHQTWDQALTHSGVAETPEGGFGTLRKASRNQDDETLIWDEIWEQGADGTDRRVFSFDEAFEPESFCYHQEIIIPSDSDETTSFDWTHANSLLLSPDEEAWILLVRHYDAVMRIDRTSGEIDWILGGPYADLKLEPATPPLDHGHMSWYRDGEMLIFDNGNHREPPVSRLVGYALDEEELSAERTLVWSDDEQTFSEWLGDVIALPQGTLLSSWTTAGRVLETSREGDLLWELNSEAYTATGRVVWLEGFYGPAPD